MELQMAKGVKDIAPDEKILMDSLTTRIKKIFELYGYLPLETPLIERFNVLASKFGAGAGSDAMKEVFLFKDQGNRKLGLRFELTLSLARYIAMNPNVKLPFKRYEIGRVYRDGPVKVGRQREFTQCDVDIAGETGPIAEAELLKLSLAVFKKLGLKKAYLEVNSRKLLSGILEYASIPEEKRMAAIISIDKLKKIGEKGVKEELRDIGVSSDQADKVLELLSVKGSPQAKLSKIKSTVKNDLALKGITELEELFSYFSKDELNQVLFDPSLARGLSYYSGLVFEGFLKDSKVTSSICGGGRYDGMIGNLMAKNKDISATGISFGLVPIMEALKETTKTTIKTPTKAFVISIGDTKVKAFEISEILREKGINSEINLADRSIKNTMNYANAMGIPYVVFVGEEELEKNSVTLKNMESGDEKMVSIAEAIKKIQS